MRGASERSLDGLQETLGRPDLRFYVPDWGFYVPEWRFYMPDWGLDVPDFRIRMVTKWGEVDRLVLELGSVTLFEEGVD